MKYSIEDIAAIIKGAFFCDRPGAIIDDLLMDSRKLIFPDLTLFFCLTGPRRNGHQFIPELYEKGVCNFVVEEEIVYADYPGVNFITVKNAMQALHSLAIAHRKLFNFPVIGITGSDGKTIVKEWLNHLLEEKFSIVRSPKSYNSQIGVPLSVWQMNAGFNLGIFEAGISESDEMSRLEKIIQPTIGVFTNIGEAHGEGFLNVRQKVNEKLQLFKNVRTLIYCKDYPQINEGIASFIKQLKEGVAGSTINFFSWSAKTEATLRIQSILRSQNNTGITAKFNEEIISITIPFIDDASIENSISCWATVLSMGLSPEYVREKFLTLTPIAMRLELKSGADNCSIINDSYSADLSSLKIALDFLAYQHQHTKKTVILSDILQSGKNEKDLYQEIADALQQRTVHRLIGIGQHISRHHLVFEKITGMQCLFFPSVESFLREFTTVGFNNETILLKGARVFQFEQIGRLLEQKVHQTVLEIDQNALLHNLREYQKFIKPETRLMAMVKAFSYGSGSYEIANLLQFQKVDYLAVAYADEGVDLRKAGITIPIMVMNPEENSFDTLQLYDLEPDIYSFGLLESFSNFLRKKRIEKYPIHIEIETGMNRLGFPVFEVERLAELLKHSAFVVKSVFSHLVASEDLSQDDFTRQQAWLYFEACDKLHRITGFHFLRHLANSTAIIRHPDLQLDMVRLGIGLYGVAGSNHPDLDLLEATTLRTTIAQIKSLRAGESVGYGRKGMVHHDSLVATVRLGYADGYPRRLGNGKGKMWVRGKLAPVIGNICMDMAMIDITGIDGVSEGDVVIVFGKELSVSQLANWAETIPYEIMTGISQRVKRVYYE